jgi:dihydroxyacetone kinase-like protein
VTTLDVAALAEAAERAAAGLAAAQDDLNAADARLGDGDTGTMLTRLSQAVAASAIVAAPSISEAFRTMAMAASSSTGSSLGTLVMTALMAMSKGTAGKPMLDTSDLPLLLDLAVETMKARGGARPGDKTVLDGLTAVAAALADGASSAAAARAAVNTFRDQPNRIGRAGRYGDKSRGLDDPGMLAVAVLCAALENEERRQ